MVILLARLPIAGLFKFRQDRSPLGSCQTELKDSGRAREPREGRIILARRSTPGLSWIRQVGPNMGPSGSREPSFHWTPSVNQQNSLPSERRGILHHEHRWNDPALEPFTVREPDAKNARRFALSARLFNRGIVDGCIWHSQGTGLESKDGANSNVRRIRRVGRAYLFLCGK